MTIEDTSSGKLAKLREAYEFAEEFLRDYGTDWKLHNKLCDMLKAALAEPPRNCDRYNSGDPVKDADDAYAEWQRQCAAADMPPSCKVKSAFRQWLFATAKPEAKGESDE